MAQQDNKPISFEDANAPTTTATAPNNGGASISFEDANKPPMTTATNGVPAPKGFFESFTDAAGLHDVMHPVQAAQRYATEWEQHPWQQALRLAYAPEAQVADLLEGIGHGAKRSFSELGKAADAQVAGNPYDAVVHGITAIPFLGPAASQAAADLPPSGPSWGSTLATTLTNPEAWGTSLGTGAAVAPYVVGAADAAFPGRTPFAPPVSELPGVKPLANAMQKGAYGVINSTVGVLPRDVKYEANPGEGYFQARLGPSWSLRSIADKAANAKNIAGKDIEDVIAGHYPNGNRPAPTFPHMDVVNAIKEPVDEASGILSGPFGSGTSALDTRMKSFGKFNPLDPGNVEIPGAMNDGELSPAQLQSVLPDISPEELWKMKRNVADNVKWTGADPANASLQDVGQGISSNLGNLLKDKLPQVKEPMRRYQNLVPLENRADIRAETGSMPLTSIFRRAGEGIVGGLLGSATHNPLLSAGAGALGLGAESVPFKTTLASGLYYGGEGLKGGFKGVYPGEYGEQPFHAPPPPPPSPWSAPSTPRKSLNLDETPQGEVLNPEPMSNIKNAGAPSLASLFDAGTPPTEFGGEPLTEGDKSLLESPTVSAMMRDYYARSAASEANKSLPYGDIYPTAMDIWDKYARPQSDIENLNSWQKAKKLLSDEEGSASKPKYTRLTQGEAQPFHPSQNRPMTVEELLMVEAAQNQARQNRAALGLPLMPFEKSEAMKPEVRDWLNTMLKEKPDSEVLPTRIGLRGKPPISPPKAKKKQ